MDPNFGSSYSSASGNNLVITETNELLPASSTRFASASTVAVTRSSGTALSIGASSSASAPQYVRFNPRSRAVTTAVTLTLASGTGTGAVSIYGWFTSAGALNWLAVDTSGNTYSALTNGTVIAATGFDAQRYSNLTLLYTWTITAGAFDTSGGTDQQLSTDCWVDAIELSNNTGSAVTITVVDGQGTVINLFDSVSIPANTLVSYIRPGGRFFDGGIFFTAGTASAMQANVRMARLRRSQSNP